MARDFANSLGEVYIKEKSRNNLSSVLESLNFSYEQLKRYQEALNAKIAEKVDIEQQVNRWKADEAASTDVNRKAIAAEIERAKLEGQSYRETERKLVAEFDNMAVGKLVLPAGGTLQQRENDYADALASLGSLGRSFQWHDPQVETAVSKLANLADDIEVEQERLVRSGWQGVEPEVKDQLNQLFSVRTRAAHGDAYVKTLESMNAELTRRAELLPQYLSKLEQITQEVTAARLLSDKFQSQQESFEISQAVLEQSRFEIVERAMLNPNPVWPQQWLILGFGLAIGLVLGGGALFVVEYSDRSLKSSEDVTEWLGLPVLGVVPKFEPPRAAVKP